MLHLERFSDRVEEALEAVSDVSQHLHDPVNAFQMMNRYTNGWMNLHENVYAENGQGIIIYTFYYWNNNVSAIISHLDINIVF